MKKILTLVCLFTLPLNVLAAGGDLDLATFGWRVAVFVVFVVLLYKFAKDPFNAMVQNRTKKIEDMLLEAEKMKENALKEAEAYKIKMQQMEQELETMKENARKVAEAERETMLAEASRQVEQMKQFAIHMIEAETVKAKNELRKEIVTIAASEAEKNLKKDISGDKANKVLDQYVKHMGE